MMGNSSRFVSENSDLQQCLRKDLRCEKEVKFGYAAVGGIINRCGIGRLLGGASKAAAALTTTATTVVASACRAGAGGQQRLLLTAASNNNNNSNNNSIKIGASPSLCGPPLPLDMVSGGGGAAVERTSSTASSSAKRLTVSFSLTPTICPSAPETSSIPPSLHLAATAATAPPRPLSPSPSSRSVSQIGGHVAGVLSSVVGGLGTLASTTGANINSIVSRRQQQQQQASSNAAPISTSTESAPAASTVVDRNISPARSNSEAARESESADHLYALAAGGNSGDCQINAAFKTAKAGLCAVLTGVHTLFPTCPVSSEDLGGYGRTSSPSNIHSRGDMNSGGATTTTVASPTLSSSSAASSPRPQRMGGDDNEEMCVGGSCGPRRRGAVNANNNDNGNSRSLSPVVSSSQASPLLLKKVDSFSTSSLGGATAAGATASEEGVQQRQQQQPRALPSALKATSLYNDPCIDGASGRYPSSPLMPPSASSASGNNNNKSPTPRMIKNVVQPKLAKVLNSQRAYSIQEEMSRHEWPLETVEAFLEHEHDLLTRLLSVDATERPSPIEVLSHPFFSELWVRDNPEWSFPLQTAVTTSNASADIGSSTRGCRGFGGFESDEEKEEGEDENIAMMKALFAVLDGCACGGGINNNSTDNKPSAVGAADAGSRNMAFLSQLLPPYPYPPCHYERLRQKEAAERRKRERARAEAAEKNAAGDGGGNSVNTSVSSSSFNAYRNRFDEEDDDAAGSGGPLSMVQMEATEGEARQFIWSLYQRMRSYDTNAANAAQN